MPRVRRLGEERYCGSLNIKRKKKTGSQVASVYHLLEKSSFIEHLCLQQLLFSIIENVHSWFYKDMSEIALVFIEISLHHFALRIKFKLLSTTYTPYTIWYLPSSYTSHSHSLVCWLLQQSLHFFCPSNMPSYYCLKSYAFYYPCLETSLFQVFIGPLSNLDLR